MSYRFRSPINAVATAIYSRLNTDVTELGIAEIYSVAPLNANFPYVVMANYTMATDATKDTFVLEVTSTIHMFTRERQSLKPLNDVIEAVVSSLYGDGYDLDDDWEYVDFQLELVETYTEPQVDTSEPIEHGVIRVRMKVTDKKFGQA